MTVKNERKHVAIKYEVVSSIHMFQTEILSLLLLLLKRTSMQVAVTCVFVDQ